jgi:type IV pilus assembly protein PilC
VVKISEIQRKSGNSQGIPKILPGKGLFMKTSGVNKRFKDKIKEHFFSELSLLLEAGIDLNTALGLLLKGAGKESEKKVLSAVTQALLKGGSFYEAIKSSGKFSRYDSQSIKIGEETGELPVILTELADYYGRKIRQKRLIIKAVSYPLIVLLTAIGALAFMLTFVVPMFEDIFSRSNNELPLFTQYIIKMSAFFRNDFVFILGAFVFSVLAVYTFLKRSEKTKKMMGILLLRIPVIGNLFKMFFFEKIYHSLTLLIRARVPVHEALLLVNEMINFSPVNEALLKIWNEIMKGGNMASSMESIDLFDQTAVLLVKIGEEVNKLDEIFSKLYQQTSEELEHKISQFGNMLEPVLIMIVGAFVALILIAMYLPIFQMGTSVF